MPRANTHTFDGLIVGYGTHSTDNSTGAVTSGGGGVVHFQQSIVGTELADTIAATGASPQAHIIPRGSIIKRATLTVVTAFTGSSSTLDIGLWTRGLATDVVDQAVGIVDAVSIAELTTVGETHVCDGTLLPLAIGVSTNVGAVGLGDCVVVPSWDTAAFTAGEALLYIEYMAPFGAAGRTIAVV